MPRLSSTSFVRSQLSELLRDHPGLVAALAMCSVLAGLSESGVLAVLAQAAAALVDNHRHLGLSLGPIEIRAGLGVLLGAGIALASIRLVLQLGLSFVPARLGDGTQARLRTELFDAFMAASWHEQSKDREGQLQELLTNQVTQATLSAIWAATLIVSGVTFVVLLATALAFNVLAAVLVLLTAVVLAFLLRPLNRLGHTRAQMNSRGYMAYASGVSEAVRLAEETHVFGAETAQRRRNGMLISAMRSPNFQSLFLSRLVPGLYQSLIYLFVTFALVALYAFHTRQVADLGAVVLLLVRAGTYGQQGQGAVLALRQAEPYVTRLLESQRRYQQSAPVVGASPLESIQRLALRDVWFSYDGGRGALSDMSLDIDGGEAVGIVGPSGAGKSTLVQILLGLRAPTSGAYLVNGIPSDEYRREDWRKRFAYVPQEPRLLHATVMENICFFRDLDAAQVERAARLAGIHDDIVSWPDGYHTLIGPRANAISGGQRQRICLARALAASPDVLVLDEPTSALDPRAEQLIQESLLSLKGKLTLVIVAHRLSTLDICERVMVVVDGQLEGFGPADELRIDNAYYRGALGLVDGDLLGTENPPESSWFGES